MNKLSKTLSLFLMMTSLFLLQGCEDSEQTYVNQVVENTAVLQKKAENNFKALEKHVQSSSSKGQYETVLNIALVQVAKEFPDNPAVDDMISTFKKDTTTDGSVFKKIKADYDETMAKSEFQYLKEKTAPKKAKNQVVNYEQEMFSVSEIASIKRFDEHFIDYINTLASISKSVQPVIISDINKDDAVGSALVGNPMYGEWKTDSSGNTHWGFFETYLFLSFLDNSFDRPGYYDYNSYRSNPSYSNSYKYDNWRNNRNYSYYNDVHSQKYSKPVDRKKYNSLNTSLTKKYSSNIKDTNVVTSQNKSIKTKYKSFSSGLVSNGKTSKNFNSLSTKNSYKSPASLKSSSKSSSLKSPNIKKTSSSVSKKSGK